MGKWLPLVLWLVLPGPVSAQYLFMDTDADTVCSIFDPVGNVERDFDVWIDTSALEDGTPVECSTGEPMTNSAYELIIRSSSSVTWTGWTNKIPEFTVDLGTLIQDREIRVGFSSPGAITHLPPGKHKLGTLRAQIAVACQSLFFVTATPLGGQYYTGFYSRCPGNQGANTIYYGDDFVTACSPGAICSGVQEVGTTWGKIKQRYR